jgi:rhodanese-related sulfurtransferase
MKTQRCRLASMSLAFALALPGLALAQQPPPAPNYPPVVTKKQVKTITLQQFKEAYDGKALGLVVDVRNENEFADGYIPGAINVPRGLIEFRIWKEIGFPAAVDMNRQMTLYCATGGRCALATKSLMDLGFTNVTSADMKFEDWVKAGYPVAKSKP